MGGNGGDGVGRLPQLFQRATGGRLEGAGGGERTGRGSCRRCTRDCDSRRGAKGGEGKRGKEWRERGGRKSDRGRKEPAGSSTITPARCFFVRADPAPLICVTFAGSGMYIEKAIDAADVWAEDSGSDAANCLLSVALTRSPKPIPAVRHAALLVLHSSKLSKALVNPLTKPPASASSILPTPC